MGSGLLKRLATSVSRSRGFAAFVGLLERWDHEEPNLLRVLTYHRVERPDADPSPDPSLNIPPETFAEQLGYVRERWRVVSMDEVVQAVRARATLPPRSLLITFDDGYRDFKTHAWPVLSALRLPATVFVPTAFPGQASGLFWWDQLQHAVMNTARPEVPVTPRGVMPLRTPAERAAAYQQLRARVKEMPHSEGVEWVETTCRLLDVPPPPPAVLSWAELRELAAAGVTLGSHTRTHALLTRIPLAEVRKEVAGALVDLEREIGRAPRILAYPAGAFGDDVVKVVEEEGYALAFTTVRGINRLETAHPLRLRRINVGKRTTLALLRAQLAGRSVGLNRFYPLVAQEERARERGGV